MDFQIGDYLTIPFGASSTQPARLEGFARDGRLKVRAYNATQGHWMPNLRTVPASPQVERLLHTASLPPAPPLVGGR